MRLRSMLRGGLILILGLAGPASAAPKEEEGLTTKTLSEQLAARPGGEDAEALAKQVRAWFGKDNLPKGANPKVEGLEVAWAIEAPGEGVAPRVVSLDDSFSLPLVRIGTTDVYAATAPLPGCSKLGTWLPPRVSVSGSDTSLQSKSLSMPCQLSRLPPGSR